MLARSRLLRNASASPARPTCAPLPSSSSYPGFEHLGRVTRRAEHVCEPVPAYQYLSICCSGLTVAQAPLPLALTLPTFPPLTPPAVLDGVLSRASGRAPHRCTSIVYPTLSPARPPPLMDASLSARGEGGAIIRLIEVGKEHLFPRSFRRKALPVEQASISTSRKYQRAPSLRGGGRVTTPEEGGMLFGAQGL